MRLTWCDLQDAFLKFPLEGTFTYIHSIHKVAEVNNNADMTGCGANYSAPYSCPAKSFVVDGYIA